MFGDFSVLALTKQQAVTVHLLLSSTADHKVHTRDNSLTATHALCVSCFDKDGDWGNVFLYTHTHTQMWQMETKRWRLHPKYEQKKQHELHPKKYTQSWARLAVGFPGCLWKFVNAAGRRCCCRSERNKAHETILFHWVLLSLTSPFIVCVFLCLCSRRIPVWHAFRSSTALRLCLLPAPRSLLHKNSK